MNVTHERRDEGRAGIENLGSRSVRALSLLKSNLRNIAIGPIAYFIM